MSILAFDTSDNYCSVSICDNGNILGTVEEHRPLMQSERIIDMIEGLMRDVNHSYDQLDYIGVTKGPGSFTGIRIGLSIAKAFSLTTRAKILAVSNFEAMHFKCKDQAVSYDQFMVILDAGRGQFYVQNFGRESLFEPILCSKLDIVTRLITNANQTILCVGNGASIIYPDIKHLSNVMVLPRFAKIKALYLCRYVNYLIQNEKIDDDYLKLTPLYIRAPSAKANKAPSISILSSL